MEPGTLILIVGAVLLAAVAAATLAGRAGVPVLVVFLGLGMLLGSDGVGGIEFSDVHLARTVGIAGLAVILFDGGISTPWRSLRPVIVPAAALSTVGVRRHRIGLGARGEGGVPAFVACIVSARRRDRVDRRGSGLLDPSRHQPSPSTRPRARGGVGSERSRWVSRSPSG